MNRHDDAFLDDVAVLALGALPAAEAQRVAAHVRTCAECRALYSQLRPAADRIGYAAEEPAGVDALAAARRKKRIMAAIRESSGASAAGTLARASRPAYVAWAAAAAAIALAVFFGLQSGGLERQNASLRQQNAGLQHDYAQAAHVAQTASARRATFAQRVFALLGPGAARYAVPQGVVIVRDGHLFMALHDLAQPAGSHVYQTWTLARGAKTVAPGTTFRPSRDGIAIVELPVSAANIAAVALSVEPAGGSPQPTTKPKFIRKLT